MSKLSWRVVLQPANILGAFAQDFPEVHADSVTAMRETPAGETRDSQSVKLASAKSIKVLLSCRPLFSHKKVLICNSSEDGQQFVESLSLCGLMAICFLKKK